jgi:hypothetical protein
MKTKLLSAVAALPLLALAGAASATEPVTLNDVQMDAVSAAGLVLFKFDLIAVGAGCCGAASTQVIFNGTTAPVANVPSQLSNVVHVVSQGSFTGVAVTSALPVPGPIEVTLPTPN